MLVNKVFLSLQKKVNKKISEFFLSFTIEEPIVNESKKEKRKGAKPILSIFTKKDCDNIASTSEYNFRVHSAIFLSTKGIRRAFAGTFITPARSIKYSAFTFLAASYNHGKAPSFVRIMFFLGFFY